MSNLSHQKRFKLFYHSLRGKFILVSVLAGLILILSSTASFVYISQSSDNVAEVLELRLKKLNETRVVMDSIWDVSYFLGEHSVAPSNTVRSLIFNKMVTSVNRLLYIVDLERDNKKAVSELQSILHDLGQLGTYINNLFELRSSPGSMYPAIEVSRSDMFNSQQEFIYILNIGIDEAVDSVSGNNLDSVVLLTNLRHQWVQMISSYRMYLINRLASMDMDALNQQVANTKVFIESINQSFDELNKLKKKSKLGFQVSDSLTKLENAAAVWIKNYEAVIATNTMEDWRADYPVIKNKIAPRMKAIWEALLDYNRDIELDLKQSLNELSSVAKNINYLIWGLTVFGLIILVALFYFIHITLLKPIQTISHAMRQEANDGRYLKPLLIKGKSLETENLIDAFSIMQLQVHSRKNDLEHQALHDTLTKLPNRLLLFDRLQQAITKEKRNNGRLTLIMMDLDGFKEINDTLGHHAGDELLQVVSKRLVECLRDADTVARLGGDEFAILVPDCNVEAAKNIALKIRECMRPAIQLHDQSLYIHGSLGLASYPEHGTDAEMLLKNADIAMYLAKRNNSAFEVYDFKQDQHSLNKLALKHKLQKAIENNELSLNYQPQVNCDDMALIGVEALVRWTTQDGERVSPEIFIPLAEESGLIKKLTEWVVKDALRQQKAWRENGLNIHLSINLSAWNLLDPDLDHFIIKNFEVYEVERGSVSFEITESVMMTDTEQALLMMSRLNLLGSNLIVDDYGTGFSSLAYLKKFPVSELKIDKSFVINMIENENDAVIVKSTIDLAHNLGLVVVAEGVETQEVLDILAVLGCDKVQGYFIERPLVADKLAEWVKDFNRNL